MAGGIGKAVDGSALSPVRRLWRVLTIAAVGVLLTLGVSAVPVAAQAGGSGDAWAWGYNAAGQLGNGSSASSSTPVAASMPTGVSFTAIAAGFGYSLALDGSGHAWAWGDNAHGELGNGSTASSPTPVAVSMPSGVSFTAIAAGGSGYTDSLALDGSGHAWAWGDNTSGQLGDGTSSGPNTCSTLPCSTTPVAVSMPSGVSFTAISAGYLHSLALDGSGQAWAWGDNTSGELGDGTSSGPNTCNGEVCSTTPVAVSMPSGVSFTAIAAGTFHSLALDGSGHAWAWGNNGYGDLGNGTTTDSSTPVAVSMPSGVSFTAIADDYTHSLALDGSGDAWAWGDNTSGQLGDGTSSGPNTCNGVACSTIPVAVSMPSGVSFTAIAAGFDHSLALDGSGQAWAWGDNTSGQLGNGTTANSTTPVAVSMPSGVSFTAIAAGAAHSLALSLVTATGLTVTGLTPNRLADSAKKLSMTVSGSGFAAGATVAANNAGITFSTVTVATNSTITIKASATSGVPVGTYNVTVTEGSNSATCMGCLQIDPPPTATSVNPATLGQGATSVTVTVSGTGFLTPAKVKFTGPSTGVTGKVTAINSTTLSVKVTVKAGSATGTYTLKVTNGNGDTASCANCLTVVAGPTISSISPTTVAQGQTTTFTMIGTGFSSDAKLSGPKGVTFSSVVVNGSGTMITAKMKVASTALTGSNLPVRVTNGPLGAYGSATDDALTIT